MQMQIRLFRFSFASNNQSINRIWIMKYVIYYPFFSSEIIIYFLHFYFIFLLTLMDPFLYFKILPRFSQADDHFSIEK